MLLFLPMIVGVARVAGVRASVAAAIAGFLALDVLFVPPYYHLTVASPADWVTLVVFLLVAGSRACRPAPSGSGSARPSSARRSSLC